LIVTFSAFVTTLKMMNMTLMDPSDAPDEQLWREACAGDREAFTHIVERYQSLVCSLAYSACGALGTSEDMAQETFVTAWHRLKELREPSKLRPWLCGIVRNIAANAARRELRRGGPPAPLEVVADSACSDEDPVSSAIQREEETLLWRILATLPENYREPLVLFYREEQSIVEVARKLDLTEETVKQRLSRGRALLRDEMAGVVESTLSRTKPGIAFTAGVMVALPMVSSSTASAALLARTTAEVGAAAAKGVVAKLGLAILTGPPIGAICSYLGLRAASAMARSERERKCIVRYAIWIIAFCFAMSVGLATALSQAGRLYPASGFGIVLGVCGWTTVLVGIVLLASRRLDRDVKRIRIETATTDEDVGQAFKSRSSN
jgi:RNA polymerase sigma factor (sigma-70 family)